jgi:hypothetical protein
MAGSYAVTWSEAGGTSRFVGSLSFDGEALRLQGGSADGQLSSRRFSADQILEVRVHRPPDDGAGDARSIILQPVEGPALRVVSVEGVGVLFEIATLVAAFAGGPPPPATRIAIAVPLRKGRQDRVRQLLQDGPPFDPAAIAGLESHHVYVGEDQVVFAFEGQHLQQALDRLSHTTSVWLAATAWRSCVKGRPAILDSVYAWRR